MIGFIRSCLTSGVAVLGASALVVTPVAPLPTRPEPPPIAPAAHAQPLAAPTTLASVQPFGLVGQQVSFHVGFVGDFLSTGAVLFGREFAIPGTLLQDIQNGTPAPTAVGRALQSFAQVEFDAGRELVGFAAQYVSFQLNFLRNVVRDVMTTVGSTTMVFATFAAGVVNQLVTLVTASLTPATSAPTQAFSTSAAPADVVKTLKANDIARSRPSADTAVGNSDDPFGAASAAEDNTAPPKKPKSAGAATTVHPQSAIEIKLSTDTTDVDTQNSTTLSKHGVVDPSTADVSEKTSPPSGGNAKHSDEPRKQHRQHDAKSTGDRGRHPKDGGSE
ncbi:MAG: hypothetical protein QOI25_1048 [Mycobacterium sp.]|nr:hypothetical protein [Mycobacterium sp.]